MPRVDEIELVTSNGYARVRLHSSESVENEEHDIIDLGGEEADEDTDDDDDDELAREDHHLLRNETDSPLDFGMSQSPRRNAQGRNRSRSKNW